MDDTETDRPSWVDRHSVGCYYCGALADERECVPNTAEYGGNDDGGSICMACHEAGYHLEQNRRVNG
jgi:hypothetical protein